MRPVAIARTAAVSAFGAGARGLGRALADGALLPGLPSETPLASPRSRKMMSPAAYLAARCLADLLRDAAWTDARDRIAYYLAVGASAGSLDDFMALLDESLVDGAYSLERFGHRGLAACNPLLAFQLMNNFTLCHGAILEGLGGPNSALFSRGAGTITALGEAVYAVASGECDRAISGGADAPTHPATAAELGRDGLIGRGLVPADAAGLLALEVARPGDIVVEGCGVASGRGRPIAEAIAHSVAAARLSETVDLVVIAPWGPPAADALRSWAAALHPTANVVSTAALGESLAASAALAVIAAADLLEPAQRALVLSLGVDGDPGAVAIARGAA
ncbi:MAG: hypothetical protein H0T46_03075 [Deltaproteobacteria bacterium]|nr:hypothetical protein [Deltaproteobacteria bacterium]